MAPPKYGDVQKSAKDLLNNDYCFDKKFKLSTKSNNGVKFTAEGVMKSKGTSGKLSAKFNVDNVSIDKLQTTTAGRFDVEASIPDVIDGLKLGFKVSDGVSGSGVPGGSINATYKMDSLTCFADLDVVEGPTIKTALTTEYEGFVVGGECTYNSQLDDKDAAGELTNYGVSLGYQLDDLNVSLATKNKLNSINLAVHHVVDSDTKIAATFEVEPKGKPKTMAVGGSKKLDDESSFTAKVDSKGVVSANYIHQLKKDVKFIASAQVDAKDFAGDSHKFGLQLILG